METFESCQGGAGHAYPEPTVRFFGEKAAGYRLRLPSHALEPQPAGCCTFAVSGRSLTANQRGRTGKWSFSSGPARQTLRSSTSLLHQGAAVLPLRLGGPSQYPARGSSSRYLFPSVQRVLSWYTFLAPGFLECHG